jgi:SGNH domain-containing protein
MKPDPERPNYLLVGDSHATHLWIGLSPTLPDVNLMQATASVCRPAAVRGSRHESPACRRLLEYVFDDFLVHNKVDKVLLAASWKGEDLPLLATTLDILKASGFNMTVLGPIVEYDSALPRLLADEILRDDPAAAAAMRRPGVRERDLVMCRLVADHGATYLSVYDAVCREGRCDEYVEPGVPLQFDGGHLTVKGSMEVGRRLAPFLVWKLSRASDVSN